jgi:pimeloyl-ACP methyl ester carboxylesterase
MAPRHGTFERSPAGRAPLHYLEWGSPDAPALVLVHATGFLAALWLPVAERLAERRRVVALDQRGHGESAPSPDGYAFPSFADDLQALIEHLGLVSPAAAGHSSGGTTIAVHAARHPGVLSRAVLIEPILPRPDWFTRPPDGRTPNSLADGARKRRAVWASRDEALASYRTRPAFSTWRQDVLRLYVDEGLRDRPDGQVELKCPPEVEAQFFEAVARDNFWPALPALSCPTLLLWGGESHLHGRGLAQSAQEALPDARTVVVSDASHFLPQERPDEVARLIENFLDEEARPDAPVGTPLRAGESEADSRRAR